MLKLILNEDFSHAIMSNNFSQSTTFQIDNYSTHQTSMNFNIDAASIANLLLFENSPITSLRIMEGETLLVNLAFGTNNVYILNYNTNIYEGGQNTSVSISQVEIQANEEPEGEGE